MGWLLAGLAVAVIASFVSSCDDENEGTFDPGGLEVGPLKGFGLSPVGFPNDYSRLPEFFRELQDSVANGGPMWSGVWRDDAVTGSDAGIPPSAAVSTVVAARTFLLRKIIVFGWRTDDRLYLRVPADSTNDWTNEEAKALFFQMLAEFARDYAPEYLFLGNETDFYYEQNPDDYDNWVAFYQAAYDTVKAIDPSIRVGTTFQYEHLVGAGSLVGWTTPRWGALRAHDLGKIDVIGITLYPFFAYESPAQIPDRYLNPLVLEVGLRPLAITETGWPAEDLGGLDPPWETADSTQREYVARLHDVLGGKTWATVNWLFLNAMEDPGGSPESWKVFGSISIRDSSGSRRSVYDEWVEFFP